ncbi:MAG TPA: hypothetical protein VFP96_04470 [Candidatus Acidoferrum sp.]|jgi:hypothetical protein|nr:hypothetical protein [Candidatus Acidoferrum sp.]
MAQDRQLLLQKLRDELAFIERGGYREAGRLQWRPQFIFEDSPMCLNRDPTQKHVPCSECVLMQFVPAESKARRAPCRHIPMNEQGETIDAFYRSGTQEELEKAVVAWLKRTINDLENDLAAPPELKRLESM